MSESEPTSQPAPTAAVDPSPGVAEACACEPDAELPTVIPRHAIERHAQGYRVRVELPGVARERLQVEVQQRLLAVRAERRFVLPEGWQPLSRGVADARFELRLQIGADLDPAAVGATLADGVLLLDLPRRAEDAPRRISVN